MAIDSERKRRSTIPGVLPKPDGSIDAGDRRTVSVVYDYTDDELPDTGTDLLAITHVLLRVDVKIVKDRGSGMSSDSAPVTITFNKTFADIVTIDVFPVSNAGLKITRVIDFDDLPDPTSFAVTLIDDDTGDPIALPFGWIAEGVLKYS